MLLFRSEEEIEAWCRQTGEPRGEVLSLEQVWRLAQTWYGDRLSPHYRGRSPAEIRGLFAEVGLTSGFWQPA